MKGFLYIEEPELFSQIAVESLRDTTLNLKKLTLGSSKKLFWQCPVFNSHIWEVAVNKRVGGKTGCPYCSGTKVSKETSLALTYPDIASQWHPDFNDNLTPFDVSAGSKKKVHWQCPISSDHHWTAVIQSRTGKNAGNCPFCVNQRLSTTNSIEFLYPELAKEWHPTLNGDLLPKDVIGGSNTRIHWRCHKSEEHVWETTAFNRTKGNLGCPFCSNRKICRDNNLETVYPDLAKEWDYKANYPLKPSQVIAGAKKTIAWVCSKNSDHTWKSSLDSRIGRGRGCPYCSGRKVSKENSLASKAPDIAAGWHPILNGKLTPNDFTSRSGKKVFWQCLTNEEHVWQATIGNRVSQNQWCPICIKPKIQQEICIALSSIHNHDWQDAKIKLIRTGFKRDIAQIDMLLLEENKKVVVEYDGYYWHKDKSIQDINTTKALMDNGYLVIRLRESTNREILPFLNMTDRRLKQLKFNYNKKNNSGYIEEICFKIYEVIDNFYA